MQKKKNEAKKEKEKALGAYGKCSHKPTDQNVLKIKTEIKIKKEEEKTKKEKKKKKKKKRERITLVGIFSLWQKGHQIEHLYIQK